MDAISGVTPFALCSVSVDSIGSKVSGADNAPISTIPNSILTDIVSKKFHMLYVMIKFTSDIITYWFRFKNYNNYRRRPV